MIPLWLHAILLIIFLFLVYRTLQALFFGAPYVPTSKERRKIILDLLELSEKDHLVDPGCGDAGLLFEASKRFGVRATGYEIFFLPYCVAKIRSIFYPRVKIFFKDSRFVSFAPYNKVFCFLLPEALKICSQKWEKELKPGSRVLSYAFPLGDWKAEQRIAENPEKNGAAIYVYKIQ